MIAAPPRGWTLVSTGLVDQAGGMAAVVTVNDVLDGQIPSPAIMDKIGTAFRRAVDRFAADNKIPVVRFGKDDPQDRSDAAVSGATGGHRSGRGGRDRGGAGVRAGIHRDQKAAGQVGVVLVHQGQSAGDLLLPLALGR